MQLNFCVLVLNDKLSVSVLCETSIGIEYPNNGTQFNKCELQGCAKYAFIKLPRYQLGIKSIYQILFSMKSCSLRLQGNFFYHIFYKVAIKRQKKNVITELLLCQ